MLRALPNAANETEFAGGFHGTCGELITRGMAHIVTGTPLDPALLVQLTKTEIADGWASANGSEPIDSVAKGLGLLLPKTIKITNYGYSNPARFDWESVLNQWGGVKPIGFEVSHAGVLPGDEKNVAYHFIAPARWDAAAGYGYFIDGDFWGARQGILARYTIDDLRKAGIVGMVVVEWTAPASSQPSSSSGGNAGGQNSVQLITPAGWRDDSKTGVLTAKNGVELVHGFRWMVLTHPGGWNAEDVPLAKESYPAHVLDSDPKSPGGAVIIFALSGKYYWTDTAHKAPDGAELAAAETQRAQAAQQAAADAGIIAKAQSDLLAAQHAASAAQSQIATYEHELAVLNTQLAAAKAAEAPALSPAQAQELAAAEELKRGLVTFIGVTPPGVVSPTNTTGTTGH